MTARKLRPEVGNWVEVTSGPDKGTHGQVTGIDKTDGRTVVLVRVAKQRKARSYPLRSVTVRAVQLAFDVMGEA
ncbi:KOW motif-containing protein [Spirillospora sp. NPDC048911]|uniref:KOW motif-containing protein n=1 Tax=Spirillospora sp. NPDC048911 TaxID=3364527 RepID=UPI003721FFD4